MSILSDTAHENMINSEAAVTYILKALFSDVFKFDGTTEVMISENIKRGCPHIWKDPNYRIISDKLFHWWLSDMPYIYLAMLEDQKFVPVLYENLKKIVEYDKNHSLDARVYDENKNVFSSKLCTGTVFHVDFTNFNETLYKKLLADQERSMHALDDIRDRVDDFVNGLSPSKRHHISYIVCNFMYLLLELMHNDDICNWFEAISNYYQDMAHAHAAVYKEACDNPDDFA